MSDYLCYNCIYLIDYMIGGDVKCSRQGWTWLQKKCGYFKEISDGSAIK